MRCSDENPSQGNRQGRNGALPFRGGNGFAGSDADRPANAAAGGSRAFRQRKSTPEVIK